MLKLGCKITQICANGQIIYYLFAFYHHRVFSLFACTRKKLRMSGGRNILRHFPPYAHIKTKPPGHPPSASLTTVRRNSAGGNPYTCLKIL